MSIGVQSFDDAMLARIGRVHDGAQARAAVEEAAASFRHLQHRPDVCAAGAGRWLHLDKDLATALGFQPPHLSVYHLTIEPNTRFCEPAARTARRRPGQCRCWTLLVQRTGEAGLGRYEVSAFARPGHRCQHNLNYWQFGDYLGLGAGAHGKLSFRTGWCVRCAGANRPPT